MKISPDEYQDNQKLLAFGLKDVKNNEVKNMEKIKATKARIIEEGKHEGEICHIIEREEPYHYVDVVIRMDDETGTELKRGYPAAISEASALGRLLLRFGTKIDEGMYYDVEKLLKGKKVCFLTINKVTEKGTFADIVPESVKPL